MTWMCEECAEFQEGWPADIYPDICHPCLDEAMLEEAELQILEKEEADDNQDN